MGTQLRIRAPPTNIIYFSTKYAPYIDPAFANRTKYLNEGTNLTITVHNVQKSDSNIYLCIHYSVVNERHFKEFGKAVILVVKGTVIPLFVL